MDKKVKMIFSFLFFLVPGSDKVMDLWIGIKIIQQVDSKSKNISYYSRKETIESQYVR